MARASEDGSGGDESTDDDQSEVGRTALLIGCLVFLVVAAGAVVVPQTLEPRAEDPTEGRGELTVMVENQRGAILAGESVELVDPETDNVVATGTTHDDGEVTFRDVVQANYHVRVGEKAHDVALDDEETETTVGVTVTPPKSVGSSCPRV